MVDPGNTTWVVYTGATLFGVLLGVAVLFWIRFTIWEKTGARWFAALITAGVLWAAAVTVNVATTSQPLMAVLSRLQIVLSMATFMLFVVFVSVYTERHFHRRRPIQVAIVTIVGGAVVLVALSPFYDLLHAHEYWVTDPFPYLASQPGVGFIALVVATVALIGYSWFVLVLHLLSTPWRSGLQLFLLLLGAFMVALMEILGGVGLLPAHDFNHAIYGTLFFLVFATVALFRMGLFEVQPVARSTIVENLADPILVLNADRELVDFNGAAGRLWPTISDLVGEPLRSVSPDLAAAVDLHGRPEPAAERVELTVDGNVRHYSATVTGIRRRTGEDPSWYAVVLRDVTDIERSYQQLKIQNERLDQVASTISHDLRNPIQVAEGYAGFLEDQIREIADEEAKIAESMAHLEEIEVSLTRMQEIIDDVLTLAREGTTVEETTTVSLEELAREAWSNVDTRDASLVVAGDRELEADRSRLLSIFENLFRNAVEHAGEATTVEVTPTESGFTVADDGPGIPDDIADDVFSYGYTTEAEGTGFGLSIVQTMAESHGWSVSLDGAAGAQFDFEVHAGLASPDEINSVVDP